MTYGPLSATNSGRIHSRSRRSDGQPGISSDGLLPPPFGRYRRPAKIEPWSPTRPVRMKSIQVLLRLRFLGRHAQAELGDL